MPEIGDVKRGREIGKASKCYFIWHACEDCGKTRWVRQNYGLPVSIRCKKCSSILDAPNHSFDKGNSWKGGRTIHKEGYALVMLKRDDFFYPMVQNTSGYVLEHRLVVAKALGRNLHLWEIVHHKHTKYPKGSIEDKQDNRIENLQLTSDDRHKGITLLENRIQRLENKVDEQGKLIKLLQWRLKQGVEKYG